MALTGPKLGSDLVISLQEAAGQPSYAVKDPLSGTFLRFGEAERLAALQLDGATPMETIERRL